MSKTRSLTVTIVLGLAFLCVVSSAPAQDWPQWRGPNRDNKVAGFTEPKTWPKTLTKKWKVTVGKGESSPTLVGGKIYVFSRQGDNEVTLCLDADTGKELWKDKYEAETVKGPAGKFGDTRSTPAVGAGKVCTLGVAGVVSCLDAGSGKKIWRKDTGSHPPFFTSTSPIIADGKCIVFVGGLTAYDLADGSVKWKWSGSAPYGSPILTEIDGVKMIVSPTTDSLVGVALADGKELWKVKLVGTDYVKHYSTPIFDGRMIYYSMGSKGGKGTTVALKIEKKDDGFKATEVWKKSFAAAGYHSPLYKDGMIFGVIGGDQAFFCADAKTGERLWTDKTDRGQCGSILDLGPVLMALTSDKHLVVFKASNKEYVEVAKYQVSDSPTWCVPIVAGNRIYVKDKGGSLTLWTIE